jgi:hypothetical protein
MRARELFESTKEECFKKFEQYLFGENLGKKEKNTKIENETWERLEQFIMGMFDNKRPRVNSKFYKDLLTLKGCQQYYKDMIAPPVGSKVYRATNMPINRLKKLSFDHQWRNYVIAESTYTPKSPTQSWTTDFKYAQEFIDIYGHDVYRHRGVTPSNLVVILEATVDDSFVLNPKITNAICAKYGMPLESEILRYFKTPIAVDVLITEDDYYDYIDDGD